MIEPRVPEPATVQLPVKVIQLEDADVEAELPKLRRRGGARRG
jgi:hypothetical protein